MKFLHKINFLINNNFIKELLENRHGTNLQTCERLPLVSHA